MKASAFVSYSEITPESAAEGCSNDHGAWMPSAWRYSMEDPEVRADIIANPSDYQITIREGVQAAPDSDQAGVRDLAGLWTQSKRKGRHMKEPSDFDNTYLIYAKPAGERRFGALDVEKGAIVGNLIYATIWFAKIEADATCAQFAALNPSTRFEVRTR